MRGGWPAIPADAKFALGTPGPNDELLRRRLIITGDWSLPVREAESAQALVERAPLVVDFRGVTRGIEADNLIRL